MNKCLFSLFFWHCSFSLNSTSYITFWFILSHFLEHKVITVLFSVFMYCWNDAGWWGSFLYITLKGRRVFCFFLLNYRILTIVQQRNVTRLAPILDCFPPFCRFWWWKWGRGTCLKRFGRAVTKHLKLVDAQSLSWNILGFLDVSFTHTFSWLPESRGGTVINNIANGIAIKKARLIGFFWNIFVSFVSAVSTQEGGITSGYFS